MTMPQIGHTTPRVFLDTSILVSAVFSTTGGSRLLLQLGEIGVVELLVGSRVMDEFDQVLTRTAPDLRPLGVLLLDRSGVAVVGEQAESDWELASHVVEYVPDARVLGEAIAARPDFFVTLDRQHPLDMAGTEPQAYLHGAPSDCVDWLRKVLMP